VLDWFSRRVLSWRLSITMEAAFCVETLEDALARHGNSTWLPELVAYDGQCGMEDVGQPSDGCRSKNQTCSRHIH
jgi:hypothetical protein